MRLGYSFMQGVGMHVYGLVRELRIRGMDEEIPRLKHSQAYISDKFLSYLISAPSTRFSFQDSFPKTADASLREIVAHGLRCSGSVLL